MSNTINLRQARKQRARKTKAAQAEINVVKHGLTKAETNATKASEARKVRVLDGHKLSRPNNDG